MRKYRFESHDSYLCQMQGLNFIAAIAVEGEQNVVDHCGNDGNCRIVQFLYYSLYITTLILEFRC
jgi:hypothetical protein